jgi:two-component system sensor histidine kinase KdpD
VLDNLTHNAVEHTPTGGTITLRAAAEPGHVKVSVSDSGPGIPQEARAHLFRKFFQRDLKRHVGNVGLGLALCEKVVTRHQGTIGIEDAKPHGACFFFTLPLAEPALPL